VRPRLSSQFGSGWKLTTATSAKIASGTEEFCVALVNSAEGGKS
jgi:hypothetical protein